MLRNEVKFNLSGAIFHGDSLRCAVLFFGRALKYSFICGLSSHFALDAMILCARAALFVGVADYRTFNNRKEG